MTFLCADLKFPDLICVFKTVSYYGLLIFFFYVCRLHAAPQAVDEPLTLVSGSHENVVLALQDAKTFTEVCPISHSTCITL